MGAPGIALATSLFYALAVLLFALWLRRTVPVALDRSALRTGVLTLLGGALLIASVLGIRGVLAEASSPVRLAAMVSTGAAVWIVWSLATRMPELGMIWRVVVKRRGPPSSDLTAPAP
jgi:hypothetical protein